MTRTNGFGVAAAGWVLGVVAGVVGLVLVVVLLHRAGQTSVVGWSDAERLGGNVVRLSFVGSECQDDASVDVDESSDRIVLTVHETVRASSCSDVGVPYTIDAELDAPVGDRELVDGS